MRGLTMNWETFILDDADVFRGPGQHGNPR